MKVVYLDSYALNHGDLNWREVQALGSCVFYDRTAPGDIVARSQDAEIILTNKAVLDKTVIEALPNLRYIGITATGTNVVDVAAAKARHIIVTNVPAYGAESVAQATFALLLELANQTGYYNRKVHEGGWQASPDFCFYDRPTTELAGLTMGLIGFGDIGQSVARLAHAFGMNILVSTRTQRATTLPVTFCGIDEVFVQSDVVSLHCPLTPETKELVNTSRLALMKPSGFLLNTSRGGLVEEQALAEALNLGRFAGAGLDVLSVEPPCEGNPLLKTKNCIITPHIAWASFAARKRLLDVTVDNVRQFQKGKPVNVVGT